ncbi:LIM domain protein [Talaromyces stipitatus ATCC 10500]|uniref:LIM domain protein n=1 Tax=Talaromyces stipitatus (strain ATCC 10500 / CBS 375.48 / QM 6759 / NRRL 1006) TaxID=441959 RepID=B8LWG9_TALSN|nr:LIM domain protein [Talaromyces stipitatus ATCC 10500]EED24280.1 LIM domain protein [Talaromyces stipitatus ATCC 10500]
MLHRNRMKDPSRKASPPGPTYMSDDQVANYLKDLRTNRPSRPNGSRPLPSRSTTSMSKVPEDPPRAASALSMNEWRESSAKESTHTDPYPRSASAMSNSRRSSDMNRNSFAGRPLVQQPSGYSVRSSYAPSARITSQYGSVSPSAVYRESGSRWMERQEARSLRDALEEMDLQDEERLHSAAQDEATKLVWEHQNPGAAYKNPHAAYRNPDLHGTNRFRQHLEKGSHARSQAIGGTDIPYSHRKSLSESGSNEEAQSPRSSNGSTRESIRKKGRVNFALPSENDSTESRHVVPRARTVSNESAKGIFRNPEDSIYEEPEESSTQTVGQSSPTNVRSALKIKPRNSLPQGSNPPVRVRNSPFDRKQNKVDIHKNPPSQTRNPLYTTNAPVQTTPELRRKKEEKEKGEDDDADEIRMKNGMEVRSDDIRAATSMKLKDRSSKLPMPTAVSDRPGQPIISFDPAWQPPEEKSSCSQDGPLVINVVEAPDSIPTINVLDDSKEDAPSITVEPPKESTGASESVASRRRKFDNPQSMRPTSQGKWYSPFTRAGVPTATCTNCGLPIEGRVVTAAGSRFHPECFNCYHCGTGLECVAFYQEPEVKREERLSQAAAEDNDARGLRFYCHLDYHELFSPRCKSCKTPIEGEVVVACGAEWHVGHFFCAECGDPFSQEKPFVEKDGFAWCLRCHSRRTASRCLGCKQPVLEDVIVTALGGQWHDKCFVCHTCGGGFGPEGRFFVKEGEPKRTAKGRIIGGPVQLAVCEVCEARRLKA